MHKLLILVGELHHYGVHLSTQGIQLKRAGVVAFMFFNVSTFFANILADSVWPQSKRPL